MGAVAAILRDHIMTRMQFWQALAWQGAALLFQRNILHDVDNMTLLPMKRHVEESNGLVLVSDFQRMTVHENEKRVTFPHLLALTWASYQHTSSPPQFPCLWRTGLASLLM
jgi:hypothetical protein